MHQEEIHTCKPEKTGRWTVVASWAGDTYYDGATSDSVSFSVENPLIILGAVTLVGIIGVIGFFVYRRFVKKKPTPPIAPPPAIPSKNPMRVMFCTRCGYKLPPEAVYCPNCGQRGR